MGRARAAGASVAGRMESDVAATFEAGQDFNSRLRDTILALIKESQETRKGVEEVKEGQEKVAKDQEALKMAMENEREERMDQMAVLEARLEREKRGREEDTGKLREGQEREKEERKKEVEAVEERTKEKMEGIKDRVGEVKNMFEAEMQAEKEAIDSIAKEARDANEARKAELAALKREGDAEKEVREKERQELKQRVMEAEEAQKRGVEEMEAKAKESEKEAAERLENLRHKMEKENRFLKLLAARTSCVYFDAYRFYSISLPRLNLLDRKKAYDGGGEENLCFEGISCNVGGGMDIHSGIFSAPFAGIYLFLLHIATHDNKKALLSIRKNGEEIASVFDQNHKDNHKNSMAGQNVLVDCQRGDEVKQFS